MGRKRKIIDAELTETVESFAVNHAKTSITQLTGKYINHFVGDTYNHSLNEAFEWADMKNEDDKYLYEITLIDYYPQSMCAKAILISYNISEKVFE